MVMEQQSFITKNIYFLVGSVYKILISVLAYPNLMTRIGSNLGDAPTNRDTKV